MNDASKLMDGCGDPFAVDEDGRVNDAWCRPKAREGTVRWAKERLIEMHNGVVPPGPVSDVVEALALLQCQLQEFGLAEMTASLDEEGNTLYLFPKLKDPGCCFPGTEAVTEIAWGTAPGKTQYHRDTAAFRVAFHLYRQAKGRGPGLEPFPAWQRTDVDEGLIAPEAALRSAVRTLKFLCDQVIESYFAEQQAAMYEDAIGEP